MQQVSHSTVRACRAIIVAVEEKRMTCRSLVALAVALAASGPAAAASLDEILGSFYDARGGLENIAAVESMRISGVSLQRATIFRGRGSR